MPEQGDKTIAAALPKTQTLNLLKRLVKGYLLPYKRSVGGALLLMALASAMTALLALLMQPVLDDVLYGGKANRIVPVAGGVFLTFFTRGFSTYAYTILMNKVSQSIIADVQRDLFNHFMALDLGFFHANPSGQLISRVISDVSVMRSAVSDSLTGIGKNAITLLFLVAVMFYQDWRLAIAGFIIFPFAAFFVAYIGRRLRKVSGSIQREMGGLSDLLSQIFQGIRQVQAYGMEEHEKKRASKAIETVKMLNIKSVRIGNLSTPVNEFMIGFVAAGIIAYGGYQTAAGLITPGQLVSFLSAFTMAYEPMKKLARLNNSLQTGLGSAERVFEMLDTQPVIVNAKGAQKLEIKKPAIAFKNVEFQYQGADCRALNGISFKAEAGKVTALVGPSGGGKSTVMNLIPRFYDVKAGTILVGDMDVRDMTFESLRASIALVSQDITIFDETIAANIAYGRAGASMDEIIEAAKAAAAHDFIGGFPEGYDARVGEDGVKLSGGQRQRIAIARAILRDAPILLLDEATSALDNESEKLIQEALEKLEKGRTTLVIAHRLSTVKSADNIIALDKGRIVEQGTHDSLMDMDGLYAKMYKTGLRD